MRKKKVRTTRTNKDIQQTSTTTETWLKTLRPPVHIPDLEQAVFAVGTLVYTPSTPPCRHLNSIVKLLLEIQVNIFADTDTHDIAI